MKKSMLLALLLLVFFESKSQIFEGTVKWTMKMDISDPKLKAQMAEAEAKMNDPKMKAEIKAMQDQLNDPKMKAMMDANPAMKAQIESQMKMMSGGGGVGNGMTPSGITMKMKGGNVLSKMDGGMMSGMETLFIKDKSQTVNLDRSNKTYTILSSAGSNPAKNGKTADVKFTKTGETTKILGYNCTKYIAMITDDGKTVNENFWTTTEIKDFDMNALSAQRMGARGREMLPAGLEGVPLRIEMSTPEGSMIMEVAELKRETLSASDFVIPSDYKEVKMSGRPY
ncbi:hypothetical protein BH09BAC3_BH09BAC3_32460 [soil metagenome]